ncbi:MAG: type II toxin-antitoxin system ParD family antitoxin [Gammaproteobacteria bacterium]|nr:type II toxin-antitoxin system ParD family antitoxin [Gammaproteobacteria bacterium]MDE0479198.1 type II toxin-antitoxin system ParD family antitoxin [Gammaproteobacteria bacterium]MXX07049.1 type II toxin-antitoxin system ParD family antitoxin [Gammaproteobacteria bacterium]MYE30045.1 type II toxin-antitoxin system ParD family antitoxin [Gammaproteobacteria bacterium]MYI01394.1 type II toxin-antitoxin system ParD family antitoxin [Gammaproteobacteria bacterium]
MGTTRKTITVTDKQDAWIKSRITDGEFTNDSEYIRHLIRQDQSSRVEAIRAALIEGEQSGEPRPFDSEQFKREMRKKYGNGTA